MRVLVTGHLGYIGTVLTPMLIAAGLDVVGCDTDLYRGADFGNLPPPVTNLSKDVRDLEAGDLVGFDAIIHLAGLSNDPLGDLDPALTAEINGTATVALGVAAKRAGIARFIFSSSCSTYGAAGEALVDESGEFNPQTPYGTSKVFAEQGLRNLAVEDFCVVFLRNATVYGYSPRLRFDLVVNNLVAWALTTGEVHLKSRGLAWRPLVHVEDVAAAFLACLQAPAEAIAGTAFNIGRTDENFRVMQLAEAVVAAIPGARLTMADGAEADRRTYRVDCSRAEQQLMDWQPQWTVPDGIQELIARIGEIGLVLESFEGPRYQRLAHLRTSIAEGRLSPSLRYTAA